MSLFAVFLTTRESPRVPVLEGMLKSSLWPLPGFRYYFINWSSKNQTDPPSLVPPVRYDALIDFGMKNSRQWNAGRKSPELLAKLFFAFDFYLQNSTARWFFRGNDDTIINTPLLRGYLCELEAKHNPLAEFVALGNCLIVPERQWPYMQGGAGYLFSRVACRRLVGMARQILAGGWGEEDAVVGEAVHDVGVTSITSDRFIGYTIDAPPRDWIVHGAYELLPGCPAVVPGGRCTSFLSRLRKVVFFHQHLPFDEYYATLARNIFTAPPDIVWWMSGFVPQICNITSPRVAPAPA
jgi:hypothetical protein